MLAVVEEIFCPWGDVACGILSFFAVIWLFKGLQVWCFSYCLRFRERRRGILHSQSQVSHIHGGDLENQPAFNPSGMEEEKALLTQEGR